MEEPAALSFVDPNSEFAANYPNGLSLDDLIPFYEDVEKGKPLQLEWKFPGRIKRPSPQDAESKNEEVSVSNDTAGKKNDAAAESSSSNQPDFAEFDFDTETSSTSMTAVPQAQRPLGSSGRPVRERRVARLDKILQEDRNLRRLEEQMRQAEAAKRQQPMQVVESPDSAGPTSDQLSQEAQQNEQNKKIDPEENPTILDLPAEVGQMNINTEGTVA